jgi:hypothetical protein
MIRATALTLEDPSNGIDDAKLVYAEPGERETDIDDEGNVFACCPDGDNGHLYLTACGVTRCVHCKTVVAV